MRPYPNADFSEPYSSVSFSYKQLTSPYPTYSNSSPYKFNKASSSVWPISIKQSLLRWYRQHRKAILLFTCLTLLVLSYFQGMISNFMTFVKIKMNNTMFDRGYVACGVLRKQPMLFVQDTHHVQVVWEMNCGMNNDNKEMILTYWSDNDLSNSNMAKTVIGPIKPKILDPFHTLYRTTIGPLVHTGSVHYTIDVVKKGNQKDSSSSSSSSSNWNLIGRKQKTIAKHTFQWFADTKEKTEEPIRMAAMADNQFGLLTFSAILRQIRKLPHQKQPHFLLHAGDAVQNYPSLRQWQTDFAAPLTAHGLLQRMPMIYAHGNHDYDATDEYIYTRSQVSDPFFAFSLGNNTVRFIILDSNLDWERQDQWLKEEIETDLFKTAKFRIVVVHVPPFLEYWDPEAWFKLRQSEWGAFVKDRFVPLFEQGGVDLVISGHQHNYERGERNGISYAIIGGAGGDIDYVQVKDWGMYEAKLLDFHFVMLEFKPPAHTKGVDDWTLQWDTFNLKGQKIDSTILLANQQEIPSSALAKADTSKVEEILEAIEEHKGSRYLSTDRHALPAFETDAS